jgi:hypothetical protein
MTIQKMKPLRNVKTISALTILTSYHQGKRFESRPAFSFHLNLGVRFLLGGVTPHVNESPNHLH